MGRPSLGRDAKVLTVSVKVDAHEKAKLKALGQGSASKGLRIVVDRTINKENR
jgi:hypothetical protein